MQGTQITNIESFSLCEARLDKSSRFVSTQCCDGADGQAIISARGLRLDLGRWGGRLRPAVRPSARNAGRRNCGIDVSL
jgi:hypothetical protein